MRVPVTLFYGNEATENDIASFEKLFDDVKDKISFARQKEGEESKYEYIVQICGGKELISFFEVPKPNSEGITKLFDLIERHYELLNNSPHEAYEAKRISNYSSELSLSAITLHTDEDYQSYTNTEVLSINPHGNNVAIDYPPTPYAEEGISNDFQNIEDSTSQSPQTGEFYDAIELDDDFNSECASDELNENAEKDNESIQSNDKENKGDRREGVLVSAWSFVSQLPTLLQRGESRGSIGVEPIEMDSISSPQRVALPTENFILKEGGGLTRTLNTAEALNMKEQRRRKLLEEAKRRATHIIEQNAQLQLSSCSKALLCCLTCGTHRWLVEEPTDSYILGRSTSAGDSNVATVFFDQENVDHGISTVGSMSDKTVEELEEDIKAIEVFLDTIEAEKGLEGGTNNQNRMLALNSHRRAELMVGRRLIDPMSTVDVQTAKGFRPVQCLRQPVERPFQVFLLFFSILLVFIIIFTHKWTYDLDFVTLLWSDFPLQIEDSATNGGYLRSLGMQAALAEQNITRSLGAVTELTQAFVERDVEFVYRVNTGDIFNMESLKAAYDFENDIRRNSQFERYCLLDWGKVGVSRPVYKQDGSPVIDPISQTAVVTALQNLDLLRTLRAQYSIGSPNEAERDFILAQVLSNLENFVELLENADINPECAWPVGPLRPASIYDPISGTCSEVLGSTPAMHDPIPGTTICRPMGLLTPDGELIETFKNERLLEYSKLSREQAPEWYTYVDKTFGPTASSFRSRFQLGWPLRNFNTTAKNVGEQHEEIGRFVVSGLVDRLIKTSENHPSMVFTFEALQSGALDGLFSKELENSVPLILASVVCTWLGMAIVFRSSVMATLGVSIAFFALAPAFLIYKLSGFKYFGLYHALSLFTILLVIVDSLIRFYNRWEQAERIHAPLPILIQSTKIAEKEAIFDPNSSQASQFLTVIAAQAMKPFRRNATYQLGWSWRRLSWTVRHVIKALMISCCTLGCSLAVNASMNLPAFRTFTIFASFLSLFALIITIVFWPSVLACHRKYLDNLRCCLVIPRERYRLDIEKIDLSDETTRLAKVESFFFLSGVHFIKNNRWAILIVYLLIVGVLLYFATLLRVDSRNVSSAIFIDRHPINRYNEVRSMFPEGSGIHIGLSFGLDKNSPVDRSSADTTDPKSFGKPLLTTSYNTPNGSFDLFKARECLLDVCEFISNARDDLKLVATTAVSQPSCVILDLHRWLSSGDSVRLGIDQKVLGLRDPALLEEDFWKAYVVFLLYEREFCSILGDVKDCWLKYQGKVSLLDRTPLGPEGHYVADYNSVVTRAIVVTASLSENRDLEYHKGIKLFYSWERVFSDFLNAGACSAAGVAEHTGFQYGLSSPWDPWHFYFFQRYLTSEVTKALALASVLCFLMVLVFTGDLFISFACIFFVGCVLALQLGVISLMGMPVGMVTVFPLLILPGIVMLNLSHVAEGYTFSTNYNPIDRIREALTKNAFPALVSACINFCACVFLTISKAAIFANYGVIVLMVYFISLFTALVVLPAFIMIFAPSGDTCNIYSYLRKKCCREDMKKKMYKLYLEKEIGKLNLVEVNGEGLQEDGVDGHAREDLEPNVDKIYDAKDDVDAMDDHFTQSGNLEALAPHERPTNQVFENEKEISDKRIGLSRRIVRSDAPDSKVYDEYCMSTMYRYPRRIVEDFPQKPVEKTN